MTRPVPPPVEPEAAFDSGPAAASAAATASEEALDSELPALHRRTLPMPVPAGEDLAAELFARLAAVHPTAPTALLDSSDHARTVRPERSRRSILAFSLGEHAAHVQHRAGQTREVTAAGARLTDLAFFDWLRRSWQPLRPRMPESSSTPGSEAPCFALGWVGWLGYELARERDCPDRTPARGSPTPRPRHTEDAEPPPTQHDARLFRATHAVILDHRTGTAELQSWGREPDWEHLVTETLAAAQRALHTRQDPGDPTSRPAGVGPRLRVRDSREEYLAKIRAAQDQIAAGNSYEVCLTTAVTGTLAGRPDGIALFRALRQGNRAPFTQYLRFDDVEILSTSPERFLSLDAAGTVRSEPIKGTRPRGSAPAEDQQLRGQLQRDPKDRAENVMITDLVRNDLSVHAVPGTLRTERLFAVESYPTVHQMVSTVSARTTPGTHPADVVAAAFPPGSMTGAPKISTMAILERLEAGRRGPYSGVAGYFSTTGRPTSRCSSALPCSPGRTTTGRPGSIWGWAERSRPIPTPRRSGKRCAPNQSACWALWAWSSRCADGWNGRQAS